MANCCHSWESIPDQANEAPWSDQLQLGRVSALKVDLMAAKFENSGVNPATLGNAANDCRLSELLATNRSRG